MRTDFLSRPAGLLMLLAAFLVIAGTVVVWQVRRGEPVMAPAVAKAVAALPKVYARDGARFVPPAPAAVKPAGAHETKQEPAEPVRPPVLPLRFWSGSESRPTPPRLRAGRMIPCELVVTLESGRPGTPLVALVTEDVWGDGVRLVQAGTEVQGRFALDRTRARLTAEGAWTLVPPAGTEDRTTLTVQGTALERAGDGGVLAGLRGQVLRTDTAAEVKLFASTFLATATLALQDLRSAAGPLGEASLPAATARNATLAGTGAVLREYAQQVREAIARDGTYVRVPAGTRFFLQVTAAPTESHETK